MPAEDRKRFNARKYGLSVGVRRDTSMVEMVESVANALLGEHKPSGLLDAANELAAAFSDLQRIDRVKLMIINRWISDRYIGEKKKYVNAKELDYSDQISAYMWAITELEKIERYERRATSQLRKAFRDYALAEESIVDP